MKCAGQQYLLRRSKFPRHTYVDPPFLISPNDYIYCTPIVTAGSRANSPRRQQSHSSKVAHYTSGDGGAREPRAHTRGEETKSSRSMNVFGHLNHAIEHIKGVSLTLKQHVI